MSRLSSDSCDLTLQEWLEVLQKRAGPTKPQEELTEKKTTTGQKEEEKKKEEEEEEEDDEEKEADHKEVPLYLALGLTGNPPAKPRRSHQSSIDQSIMEMQRTYPDLAIRGRRLLSDNTHRANSSRSTASTKAAKLPTRASVKDNKAGATALCSKGDSSSKADEVFGCNGRSGGRTTAPGDAAGSSFSNTDGNGVNDELSPQCVSLHITLRAGATAQQRLKTGEPQPTAEPPAWTQQQTAADLQNKRPVSPEHTSLSSTEEERDLRELAERMGQLHVQEPKEEVKRKEENKREEESTSKERRKKERKTSSEGEAKEQNLRRPVMETGPVLSCAAGRCTRSSQSDPAVMKEQRQPAVCQPSLLSISTADCQSCTGGQQEGDSERAETGRGEEEEELAEEYCIL
ncbi:DNA ligase 1-like [Morone saxatilis]|uniref:DNA ligase 1-like n=1 Tax=Morone saxatilis TaxID=34816 RepID=UPI0015E1E471|nr:DNA ligase 1-like [Morone saxatilis]